MSGKELRKRARTMAKEQRGPVLLVSVTTRIPILLYLIAFICLKFITPHGMNIPLWVGWIVSFTGTVLKFGGIKAMTSIAEGREKPLEGFFFYASRELIGKAILLSLILTVVSAIFTGIPNLISQYGAGLTEPVGYEEIFSQSTPVYGESYELGIRLVSLGRLTGTVFTVLFNIFSFPVCYRFVFRPEDSVPVQIKKSLRLARDHIDKIFLMQFWLDLPLIGFAVGLRLLSIICIRIGLAAMLIPVAGLVLVTIFYVPYADLADLFLAEDIMGLLPAEQKKKKKKKKAKKA